ncbi:hypothetical protein [Hyphomonas sp.]|uniref:hypothetical protein n=1 Tax=Hyphomonas sp. TaxID=87 RepID=UPI0032971752
MHISPPTFLAPHLLVNSQIQFFSVIILLLVEVGDQNAGQLNPAIVEGPSVTIIVRITLKYREIDENGVASKELTLVFEATVVPEDWTVTPCSYLQKDCIVFKNDEIIMFAPDTPDVPGVLSIDAFDNFTAATELNVISQSCDVRCAAGSNCTTFGTESDNLDSMGPGIGFGNISQSTFNNGFCEPSIFGDWSFSYSF